VRVLVTGAGGGLGAATAGVLTAHGCEVIATARRVESLDDVAAAVRLPLDVTSDDSVRDCMLAAGDVDVLVNNAGIGARGPLERLPIERFRECLETNTVGALRMVQAVVPAMRRRGSGVIVNVSSVNGKVGAPLGGAYAASKFALEGMSESLRLELGHFGIRVVVIEPGYVAPGMQARPPHGLESPYDELDRQMSALDTALLGEGGRPPPEIVGEAIWEAISDEAPPLRRRVGADAEMVLSARASLDDAAFEEAMRATIHLTW
jgi:NAD(P)-dependent dehydrogenase (short-subunit alcohol dehydrogenase family)